MPLSTILYKKTPSELGTLTLDVVISENHQFDSKVTQYPIESGGEVADHIINDPVILSMTGIITNSPIKIFGGILSNLASGQPAIPNRVGAAFTLLTDMREIKERFVVVTGLKVYNFMFFKSLSFPRDGNTGDALRIVAVLTRISKAASKKVEVQNLDPGTTDAKKNTKDLGAEKVDQGGKTVTDSTTEETARVSTLKRAATAVFGGN